MTRKDGDCRRPQMPSLEVKDDQTGCTDSAEQRGLGLDADEVLQEEDEEEDG